MGQEFVARNGIIALKNSVVSGSLNVTNGVTSSLFGTASWSNNSISASYYGGSVVSSSYSFNSTSASYSFNATSASISINSITASNSNTSSWAINSITASYANLLNQILQISGAIQLKPTQDPDPTGAITTDTFLYVSSSNTVLGQDLYIRQDGNLIKWKWVEGGLSTGVLYGGIISASGSIIYVTAGTGIINNLNASTSSEINPQITYVRWNDYTASATFLTASQNTYLYVDNTGTVRQQSTYFDQTQYAEALPLGRVIHANYTTITSFGSNLQTTYDSDNQQNDFIRAFGPLKVNGFTPTGQTGSLRINIGSGTAFNLGGYYPQDPNSPSHYTATQQLSCSIVRAWRTGSGVYQDNNNGSFYTEVDPSRYDDTGTLSSVPSGQYTIQRIYYNPVTKRAVVYYGQAYYNSLSNALTNLSTDPTTEGEFTAKSLVFAGYLIIKSNCTDLSSSTDAKFIQAGIFRSTAGGSSSAGTVAQNLDDLSDVSITTPSNGQGLIYNGGIWINGVPLSSSYSISSSNAITSSYAITAQTLLGTIETASYAITASFLLGSIQSASYSLNATSASYSLSSTSASYSLNSTSASYALNSTSASYSLNSTSASYSLNATSASYSLNTTSASYSLNSTSASFATSASAFREVDPIFTSVSNSLATTGSNVFRGGQFVTGSFLITGSLVVTGSISATNITSSLFGTASWSNNSISSSYSFSSTSASYSLSGLSSSYSLNATSASYALNSTSASYSLNSLSSSFATSASAYREVDPVFTSVSNSLATTGSNIFRGNQIISGSLIITGSVTGLNFTGSLFGTSSWSNNSISSSYSFSSTSASYAFSSTSASYSLNSTSASYSLTSLSSSFATSASAFRELDPIFTAASNSFATTGSNVFRGNQIITGSLFVTGSLSITGSVTATSFTGSLFGTSSWSINSISSSYSFTSTSASYSLTSTSSSFAATASLLLGSVVSASYALSASWAPGSTGATPGGPNTSIQFNDSSTFSGSGNFTFNKSTNNVVLTGSMFVSASSTGTIFNINTTVPNTFFVSASGRVALGTSDPQSLFHLRTTVAQQVFRLENTVTDNYTTFAFQGTGRTFYIGVGNNAESFFGVADKFHVYDANSNAIRMVIDTSGRVGLGGQTSPSYTLDVTGDGRFTSTLTANLFTEVSSLRYKKNIQPIDNQLNNVLNLNPVTYQLKEKEDSSKEYGLIAEEVAKIYPECVQYNEKGEPDSVQYSRLVVVLIDCIKELKKEIDELNFKIK